MEPTLCHPDEYKSCFACCPPIRPPGYEHLTYKSMVQRVLRENTRSFDKNDTRVRPITGFSCWAMGYLDADGRRVGCLLHPALNDGRDLRNRVDYWDKCSREICPDASVFSGLSTKQRRFWLQLSAGLDSFAYSSRRVNPLFSLIGWGIRVLSLIASEEDGTPPEKESFFRDHIFFTTSLNPKGNAYLLGSLMERATVHLLGSLRFKTQFELFSERITQRLKGQSGRGSELVPVHLLDMDRGFTDFLRLSIGIRRISHDDALGLKTRVDGFLEQFLDGRT